MSDAYNSEMLKREAEAMRERETVIFELPKRGPVSWNTLERCAREAGVPMQAWVEDALAAHVRMHERVIHERQAEAFGTPAQERRRVPAWRMRVGEWAYRMGDWLTDDGTEA